MPRAHALIVSLPFLFVLSHYHVGEYHQQPEAEQGLPRHDIARLARARGSLSLQVRQSCVVRTVVLCLISCS